MQKGAPQRIAPTFFGSSRRRGYIRKPLRAKNAAALLPYDAFSWVVVPRVSWILELPCVGRFDGSDVFARLNGISEAPQAFAEFDDILNAQFKTKKNRRWAEARVPRSVNLIPQGSEDV